jgi:hypothetical protein
MKAGAGRKNFDRAQSTIMLQCNAALRRHDRDGRLPRGPVIAAGGEIPQDDIA